MLSVTTGASPPKIDNDLALVSTEFLAVQGAQPIAADVIDNGLSADASLWEWQGTLIGITAVPSGDAQSLANDLASLGMQSPSIESGLVTGFLPAASVGSLTELNSLRYAEPALKPRTSIGATTSGGDSAQGSQTVRASLGVDGTGVNVGVISDSYNTSHVGSASADVSTGDLPGAGNPDGYTTPVNVLRDNLPYTDEGRAMLQIVHDVAPGAHLLFSNDADAGGTESQATFAQDIRDMRSAGANVIVDDEYYYTEPFFMDGLVAQAVNEVQSQGVTYVAPANNFADNSYESSFRATAAPQNITYGGVTRSELLHDFDPGSGVDTLQRITIPHGNSVLVLQWDDPFITVAPSSSGATRNFDFYMYSTSGAILTAGVQSVIGGNPDDVIIYNNPGGALSVDIAIGLRNGANPGGYLKYVIENLDDAGNSTIVDFPTHSGTVYGHGNATGAITVGAADYKLTPANGHSPAVLESYSGVGGVSILFDTNGNRLTAAQVRNGVAIVGPDKVNTTFFGKPDALGSGTFEADGFPNFPGTSAAAPHIAALAALIKQRYPSLPPNSIKLALERTASDMGTPGLDVATGYGFVNAAAAMQAAATMSGDYDESGRFDENDYSLWRSTFGSTTNLRADGNGNGVVDAADYVLWANVHDTLTGHPIGDYNGNGIVGFDDYNLWRSTFGSTTNLGADGNHNGVVDAADYVLWRDTFSSAVGAARFGVLDPGIGSAPEVAGFAISNAAGSTFDFATLVGSGEQLRSIPLSGANSISITFNQNVTVSSGALTLLNLDGMAPTLASFTYDTDSQTGTWIFGSSLSDGRYLVRLSDSIHNSGSLALDGAFTNPWTLSDTNTSIFGSGDGDAGGEFRFRFTVLSGDVDHDNIAGTTNYQNWQSYEPGFIHVSTTTDEYDTDLSFGDVSLREAVDYANNATESTTIDLPGGRYVLSLVGTESTPDVAVNDLDILGNVSVVGHGAGATVIDASALGTAPSNALVFTIDGATKRLFLSSLTITHGTSLQSGEAAVVMNGATLDVVDSAIVNNLAYAGGTAISVTSANLIVSRSVFTSDDTTSNYGGAAINVYGTTAAPASITVGQSIFALNVQPGYGGSTKYNVKVSGTVTKVNNGNNLFDYAGGNFFDTTPGVGDYLGTPTYVVTSVADTFNHSDDAEALSVREAVDLANTTSGTQEIWIPAWKFTLTRDRGTATTDTDVSIGDLDITDSVVIRGVANQTSIAWKPGVKDRVFELLGDYTHDGSVDSADYVMWANENGLPGGSYEQYAADGNDDGVVDSNDYDVWRAHDGNTSGLHDVAVTELVG